MILKESLIANLKMALVRAEGLCALKLASQIQEIGFQCLGCGECCRGDDNSVIAFPSEIREIMAATDLEWLQVAGPPEEGEWDSSGNFHTLEWRLEKSGLSCRFYKKTQCSDEKGVCIIYGNRPLLCRTYPFYLDEGKLYCSECPGLGKRIEADEAESIAKELIRRHITEIKEAIALIERYEDFTRGNPREGGDCIVHDSEGEHKLS